MVEYEVPPCRGNLIAKESSLDSASCRFTLRHELRTIDTLRIPRTHKRFLGINATVTLVHALPHCHAPTCESLELYDGHGALLCRIVAKYGLPDYFIRLDPCMWGDASEGLPMPPVLPLFGPYAKLVMVKVHTHARA